jgi:hypothetical protein
MEAETKDSLSAGRLDPEKVEYLEQEGWSWNLERTKVTKMWPDGNQSEIPFEHVRDWTLKELKVMLASFPEHPEANRIEN